MGAGAVTALPFLLRATEPSDAHRETPLGRPRRQRAARWVLDPVLRAAGRLSTEPLNVARAGVTPRHAPPTVENWEEVAPRCSRRVRRELGGEHVRDATDDALLKEIAPTLPSLPAPAVRRTRGRMLCAGHAPARPTAPPALQPPSRPWGAGATSPCRSVRIETPVSRPTLTPREALAAWDRTRVSGFRAQLCAMSRRRRSISSGRQAFDGAHAKAAFSASRRTVHSNRHAWRRGAMLCAAAVLAFDTTR